ncbi:MAG: S-layer homology domain-containing protein [Propioniciclava sp.]|uniref:S-layer homology domain-containing protein n=1 Tax=Propioniciclava sp. TaxID=2038686 RepID=UPI0039E6FCB1
MMRRSILLRLFSLLLVPALLFTSAPPAQAATPTFVDVPQGTQFQREIEWLATQGISEGWTENGKRYYKPLQPIARDAMAAFLYRFAGRPAYTPPATSPFADLKPADQFYKEITWLYSTGITTGWVENGKRYFKPLAPIARDAMAAFLYRYYVRATGDTSFDPNGWDFFDDVSSQDAFFKEITWVASNGISTGWLEPRDTGLFSFFRPLDSVKRDAMAAFLFRTSLVLAMHGDTPQRGNMPAGFSFTDVTRQSTDFGPLILCFPQRIPYYASLGARTAGRMVENGGGYGDEGEEHYYSEAALVFPTAAAAQQYVADIAAASATCASSGYPGFESRTTQPTGNWTEAISTISQFADTWTPWGTESLVARRGRSVVHVFYAAQPIEAPDSITQEARTTATTLLDKLPG